MKEFFDVALVLIRKYPKKEAVVWICKYVKFRWFLKRDFVCDISDLEMKKYSQNGEDGILQNIFLQIGCTNKYFVEFGVEDGKECNTRYLRERGWKGLWMDGKFENQLVKKEWITKDNIEKLLLKYKVPKEFDLLSIDIDSNDYWIWKAITHYKPRVVVIEYNASIGVNRKVSVKYENNFINDGTDYFGASLAAYVELAKSKGYRLVGCESNGVNAFFVREELAEGKFANKRIEELYRPPGYGIKVVGKWRGYVKSKRMMIEVKADER